MVHEQTHLHDRQRTALLAVSELYQAAFLLALEEVVRQVIVHHLRVSLPELPAPLVYVRLDFIELFGKQRQCPVHLLQSALGLLEELPGIFKRGPL